MLKNSKEYSLVRTAGAGVLAGVVEFIDGVPNFLERGTNCLSLSEARRFVNIPKALTLNDIAINGAPNSQCKCTITIDKLYVTNVLEVIPCSLQAEINIKKI